MTRKNIYKWEFSTHGIKEIDISELKKQWNHLWYISQWNEEYRIIKAVRKDSALTALKISISPEQAQEIIEELCLEWYASGVFRYATSWRKPEHNKYY